MLKRALSVILQTVVLLLVFLAGSLLPALNRLPMWRVALSPTRFLVLDGLALTLVVYLVILVVEVLTKRLRNGWLPSTLAFVLALFLGWAMKFPFMGV